MRKSFLVIAILGVFCFLGCNDKPNPRPNLDPILKNFVEGESIAGYRYEHHVKNNGESPEVGAMVGYHQSMVVGDSVIFDTRTAKRPKEALMPAYAKLPTPLPPDYVALRIMSPGDSLTIFQPLKDIPTGKLPAWGSPEDIIEYRIKLVSVKQPAAMEKEVEAIKAMEASQDKMTIDYISKYKSGALADQLIETKSGLKYVVLKKGEGPNAREKDYVKVHYSGVLVESLQPFDNTYRDGQAYRFPVGLGRVIKGWDEGLTYMNEGAAVILFIPYTLGYGADGKAPSIPAKAELAFYVELLGINN